LVDAGEQPGRGYRLVEADQVHIDPVADQWGQLARFDADR